MRQFLALLLASLTLCLSSCIEGNEELWINKDGSGRIEATYRIPPAIMNRFGGADKLVTNLRTALEKEPDIKIDQLSHHLDGSQIIFTLNADFDDANAFINLPSKHLTKDGKPTAESAFLGDMKLKISGLTLKFNRAVDLSSILPDTVRNSPAVLGKSTFDYTLHLPLKPSKHNAHSTSNDGMSLHWSFRLKEHTNSPMLIQTSAFLVPIWAMILGATILILAIFLIVRRIRKRRTA